MHKFKKKKREPRPALNFA